MSRGTFEKPEHLEHHENLVQPVSEEAHKWHPETNNKQSTTPHK